jgi:hypothetical protein
MYGLGSAECIPGLLQEVLVIVKDRLDLAQLAAIESVIECLLNRI